MKPLLQDTDLRYLRRMVREINSTSQHASVFAKYHPFPFRVKRAHLALNPPGIIAVGFDGIYRQLGPNDFYDSVHGAICASRES